MRYADVIWGSLTHSKIESFQRLQDRVISMIHASKEKTTEHQISSLLNNVLPLIGPLWLIRSLTSSVQKIYGIDKNPELFKRLPFIRHSKVGPNVKNMTLRYCQGYSITNHGKIGLS